MFEYPWTTICGFLTLWISINVQPYDSYECLAVAGLLVFITIFKQNFYFFESNVIENLLLLNDWI